MATSWVDSKRIPKPIGQIEFRTPGADTWTAPNGVETVSVVVIGGGGRGNTSANVGGGGGGGGLAWRNNISVTPGTTYNLTVGAGGDNTTVDGGNSTITFGGTTITGYGGVGATLSTGGTGGGWDAGYGLNTSGADGNGGQGGAGGDGGGGNGGGGGGAGGYTGNGGAGSSTSGSSGAGGGAGGGGGSDSRARGGGGGTAPYGEGADGSGGSTDATTLQNMAGGGSSNGQGNHGRSEFDEAHWGHGGLFGGGGSGEDTGASTTYRMHGAPGIVRIIWGGDRSFPSNAGNANGDSAPTVIGIVEGEEESYNGTSQTVNVPTHSEGDLILVFIQPDSAAIDGAPPTNPNPNFKTLYHYDWDSGNNEVFYAGWRIASASEPASYEFDIGEGSGTDLAWIALSVRSNVGTYGGWTDSWAVNYTSSQETAPSITPYTSNKCRLLTLYSQNGSTTALSTTPPTGMTLLADTKNVGTGGISAQIIIFSEVVDGGVATGTRVIGGTTPDSAQSIILE